MTPKRTWAIACAVFLGAFLTFYSVEIVRDAAAQDKVPTSETPTPEPSGKEPANSRLGDDAPAAAEEPVEPPTVEAEPTTPEVLSTETDPPSVPALVVDVPDQPELMDQVASVQAELEAGFEPGEADGFREVLAQNPDVNSAAVLGQLLFMRRHFARSAWFFAEAVRTDPNDASALNNFGVLLDETFLSDPSAHPTSWVRTAIDAIGRADALRPGDPAIQNNLGRGHLSLWQTDADAADLDVAASAIRNATAADPENVVFLANEALFLDAIGDPGGAADALMRAHAISPNHPALRVASSRVSPATSGAYAGTPRNYCSVDFRCSQTCPPSIIGRIQLVSCEIEQSNAQMACGAGQPYATTYDCSEEIPEFGILIPGLNAGFTIPSPWGSISAVVDGEGNVEWRVEAGPNLGPVNPYVRFDGGYQPDGGWSVSDTRAGVKVNLVHGNEAGEIAGNWGFQPLYVQAEGSTSNENVDVSLGAYGNATIWH